MAQTSLSQGVLEALLAPFSPEHLGWLKVETELDHARFERVLSKTALFERLDDILESAWSLTLEVVSPLPAVVVASLELGGLKRSGIGEGLNLRDAEVVALSSAALSYGIAFDELAAGSRWERADWRPDGEARGVDKDVKTSPRASEPDPDEADAREVEYEDLEAVSAHEDPPAPALDPERVKAQKFIDDMLEKLKGSDAALHRQGLQIMMKKYKGYGSSLEESRALYLELKDLLKKARV